MGMRFGNNRYKRAIIKDTNNCIILIWNLT